MAEQTLPLLLEPEQLVTALQQAKAPLLLVDVCSKEEYASGHVPGAAHLKPALLQSGVKPTVGKLPEIARLRALFSSLGLQPDNHVVAMDHEGGGWAARLLWTLDVIGHKNYSYLNGGTRAWKAAGLVTSVKDYTSETTKYAFTIDEAPIAHLADITKRLEDPGFAIWDTRSAEEYSGE
ncbi:MAG: thiosulfate/3-mercaptopyruvate sulfurtransferase, partial [Halieaceae bacterium]